MSDKDSVVGSSGEVCCDEAWEEAYARFETPEEEVRKFTQRLRALGCEQWSRDSEIVELFCGRGSSLKALERMGFHRLEGVDLSPSLIEHYDGPATLHVGDCRQLPFAGASKDVLVVQGGLHHLPVLPEDLSRTLAEASRVLRPSGVLVVVEPWDTLFLRFVHAMTEQGWARSLYPKLDAMAVMVEHERETYEQWLSQPKMILREIDRFFVRDICRIGWGKLRLRARPLGDARSDDC